MGGYHIHLNCVLCKLLHVLIVKTVKVYSQVVRHLVAVTYWKMLSLLLQWTTDEDLTEAIRSIGITDVLEIKFFENRANGQSKG